MNLSFCIMTLLVLHLATTYSFELRAEASPPDKNAASTSVWLKQTPETLKAGIERNHPAAYYILALKLFGDGKKEEAVFWFYAGQLRYRFYLKANPSLNPSGDPALFASLSETIGRPLNEYAFGDIPRLAKTMEEVLRWDESHENGFTSKTAHLKDYAEIREGLVKLREYVLKNQDEIKRQRVSNGLENR